VNLFPSRVDFEWEALDDDSLPGMSVKKTKEGDTIPAPSFVQTTPDLNRDTVDRLRNPGGLRGTLAKAIVDMRNRDGSFTNTANLVARLKDHIYRNSNRRGSEEFYENAYERSFQAQLRDQKDNYVINGSPIEVDKL
jgi:hypothetical protein